MLHGVLVVDKPAGMTSAAVVARVKRALGIRKIGHTGTLDPMATGVLPLVVGEATKIAGYLLAEDKAYEGELLLGIETDTLDADGRHSGGDPEAAARVDRDAVTQAMAALTGDIEQVPPMYSALKHEGRRLHELARAGHDVERPARRVRVDRFELLAWAPPRARFAVDCSKGTYVRSLVRDLGAALGCGAHLTALRRVRAGSFTIENALTLDDVQPEAAAARGLVPAAEALAHVPAATIAHGAERAVADGKTLPWEEIAVGAPPPEGRLTRLLTGEGRLMALVTPRGGRVRYQRVFRCPL